MKLHPEGYRIVFSFIILSVAMGLAVHLWLPVPLSIKLLIEAGLAGLLIFVIRFFRFPPRHLQKDENKVVCPADGKVVVIEEVDNAEYFGDKRIQVSIFMSPYDIHVNWVPVKGVVRYQEYFPGRYLVAWHPKSSLENERTSVVLSTDKEQEILVRQIAGAVARRVVCYAKESMVMDQGDQLGFIKFGSRVDLILPLTAQIHVKLNERVTGRETVIASLA